MAVFEFGPWLPDTPDLSDGTTITEARNVVSSTAGYEPQPSLTVQSESLSGTVQGAFACLDPGGSVHWFAGTADQISHRAMSDTHWQPAGTGYPLSAEDRWEFVRYGNAVYATSIACDLQRAPLAPGPVFSGIPTAPRARHIGIVKNFLVLANTVDSPQRVQWPGLDNPLSWTIDAVTQADFQDLLGPGGWNQAVVTGLSGADAVIMQEHALWRMMYVGPPLVFQFDLVENARGAVAAGSVVQNAGFVFYVSEDGFFAFDGTSSTGIGTGKVDNFFFRSVDAASYGRITAISDIERPLVFWSYQSTDSDRPDKILGYNWQTERWTLIEQVVDQIWRAIDFTTGATVLAAIDSQHRAGFFDGPPLAAAISSGEMQLTPGRRSFVSEVWPLLDGGTPAVSVGHRGRQIDAVQYGAAIPINALGFSAQRNDDRYHRFRHVMAAGQEWSKFRGYRVNAVPTGDR